MELNISQEKTYISNFVSQTIDTKIILVMF